MNFSRRAFSTFIGLGILGAHAAGHSNELSYPNKPITIIYPYAGGSASDTLTRQLGEYISKALGQPVIVDSKPGAGGSLALGLASRSAADGYTLVLTASGTMSVNPHIYNLKYKPVDDLASITTLVEIPFIVVTRNEFPVTNLKEFVAYAIANPGKISFANAGMGTQAHLTQMMFLKAAGIEANVVSYKGGAPALNNLLGGHIDAMIDNAAAQVPNVQAGRVRPLFVTTRVRVASLPGVPTAEEAGLGGFVTSGWFGLAAPKGTPQEIIDKLNSVIVKAYAQEDNRKKLLEAGWIPIANTPSEADARARAELVRFGATAQELNLKPN